MKNRQNIQCEWMAKNNVLVNIDGQVYPCCYLANSFSFLNLFQVENFPDSMEYVGRKIEKKEIEAAKRNKPYLADQYSKFKDDLNLNNNSLEEIINHEWFIKILPESWDNEDQTHRLCKKYCTITSEYYIKNKSNSRNDNGTIEQE